MTQGKLVRKDPNRGLLMLAILGSFTGVVMLQHRAKNQNQSFAVTSDWN